MLEECCGGQIKFFIDLINIEIDFICDNINNMLHPDQDQIHDFTKFLI